MPIHPDDEPGWSGPLWDATPGVCCAAFQLGACAHTEAAAEAAAAAAEEAALPYPDDDPIGPDGATRFDAFTALGWYPGAEEEPPF